MKYLRFVFVNLDIPITFLGLLPYFVLPFQTETHPNFPNNRNGYYFHKGKGSNLRVLSIHRSEHYEVEVFA